MKSTKSFLFLLILLLTINFANGQKENSIWHFGLGASLDFNSGAPVPVNDSEMLSKEGCASVSDGSGNLLFYTNGLEIWNKNNLVMENGTGLLGGSETSSTHQVLIVPQPFDPHLYIIFTTDERAGGNGLNYSIVDISKNSGLGAVILKNRKLYAPTTERMTLARHTNQTDYWLITHAWNNDEFRTFLIDRNGVNSTPIISKAGSIHQSTATTNLNSRGCMQVNLSSNKLALSIAIDELVETFHFDNCTGNIIHHQTFDEIVSVYGVAFSPNSQWLYVTNLDGELYQIDLNTENIEKVGQTSGDQLGAIRYANDGKMYIAVANSNDLSIIDAPNEEGRDCNYIDRVINLANGKSGEGLPQRIPIETAMASEASSLGHAIVLSSDCVDENILFSLEGSEFLSSITWQIDDFYPKIGKTTDFTFRDTGVHMVSVIFESDCHLDTLIESISIRDCAPPIFVPNGFSPNQDGVNDVFEPKGNLDFIETYEMTIFSRWGERIFYTKNIENGWDGTFRNQHLGDGVYLWMMKIKYFGVSKAKVWSGDLTLIR